MGHTEIKLDKSGNNRKKKRKKSPPKEKKPMEFIEYVKRILSIVIICLILNLAFFIQDIEVRDNKLIETSEFISWLEEDVFSFNSFYLWVKHSFTEVEYPIQVEEVKVTFKKPWEVTISIVEKNLIGGVVTRDGYAYYDKEGIVLLKSEEPIEGVMFFEGTRIVEAEMFEKLPVENTDIFEKILEVGGLMESESLVPDTILQDGDNVILEFGTISIMLGSNNYDFKVRHIQPILEELEGKEGVLNLENYNSTSDMITFK